MKKGILLLIMSWSVLRLTAQQEMSAFTATGRAGVSVSMSRDYQSLGINPANLGIIPRHENSIERKRICSLGFAEGVGSVSSDALSRPDLRDNFFSFHAFDTVPLTQQQKIDAALAFANAGVSMNADVMAVGMALQPTRASGGFAFSVRDRFASSARFNTEGASVLFLGFNYNDYFDSIVVNGTDTTGYSTNPVTLSQLFGGSRMNLSWYREFNFGYGRVLVETDKFRLYGGAGAKMLVGMGYLDINLDPGAFTAVSALSPVFGVDYGGVSSPSQVNGNGTTAVGRGFAMDFGVTASFGLEEKLKIGLSLTDVGSLTWNGNVYSAKDTLFNGLSSSGANSYNLLEEMDNISGGDGFFTWQGEQKVTVKLPTRIRLGGSYDIHKKVQVGADLIIPANNAVGNFDNAFFAAGIDYRPVDWFRVSSGFSTSTVTGLNVPLGIYFNAPNQMFELGIASRDAVTFFASNTPTLSLAMGLLRFKF